MSFATKNNQRLNQIINQNNEMRNVIYESANNIEFLLKEFYKEQKRKPKFEINEKNIDLLEMDNLPLTEQIDLYKECIFELQKETPEMKNNRIEIENINKEINELKLKLSEEKKANRSLEKMNNNYLKIIKNIDIDSANLKQEEKEQRLQNLTEDYHTLKQEYKNTLNFIKKQDKSILILEDNCKFIGENIYYKKSDSNKENKEENEDFEEIKKMAEDVQNLKENLENKYENKIKRQKEEINKLNQFNSMLNELIEEQKRNNKLEMINKAKNNYKNESNYDEDNI